MEKAISLPQAEETNEKAGLLYWRVAVGDAISCGQVIAQLDVGNASLQLETQIAGVIKALVVASGQTVRGGAILAILDGPVATNQLVPVKLRSDLPSAEEPTSRQRIALTDIEPLAPDVVAARPATTQDGRGRCAQSVKIRHLVARKMEEAWRTIPHFFVTMAVDMTDVIRLRKDLGVTINDFVMAASARALHEHPWVNATWNGEQGVELPEINISIAVATDRGLYNPVLHHCEKLSLKQISRLAHELAEKASCSGRLRPEQTEGGTFTITNMGMLGVESFNAIITPPQAAALAVGTVKGEIVVDDQGEPAVAPIMRLTLSADHRVLDGADAAEFLDTIKSYLEAPIMLVTD